MLKPKSAVSRMRRTDMRTGQQAGSPNLISVLIIRLWVNLLALQRAIPANPPHTKKSGELNDSRAYQ
jgi:hypothetical protein